eukprot:SAG31_NODE_22880_length_516_cov_0.805755_1_plen_91_part_10
MRNQVGAAGLPESIPENAEENDEFLQMLHSVLVDVRKSSTALPRGFLRAILCRHECMLCQTHVKEGELVSQCGRRYPIEDAIPNMLLKEEE